MAFSSLYNYYTANLAGFGENFRTVRGRIFGLNLVSVAAIIKVSVKVDRHKISIIRPNGLAQTGIRLIWSTAWVRARP